jgi:hypothetical protein
LAKAFFNRVDTSSYSKLHRALLLHKYQDPLRNVIVAILPFANERASTFSQTALFLQQYLRSLDPDGVESVLDREPPSDAEASSIPAAGELVCYLEPRTEKFSALTSVLKVWANRYQRHLVITFPFANQSLRLELSPTLSEGANQLPTPQSASE